VKTKMDYVLVICKLVILLLASWKIADITAFVLLYLEKKTVKKGD